MALLQAHAAAQLCRAASAPATRRMLHYPPYQYARPYGGYDQLYARPYGYGYADPMGYGYAQPYGYYGRPYGYATEPVRLRLWLTVLSIDATRLPLKPLPLRVGCRTHR